MPLGLETGKIIEYCCQLVWAGSQPVKGHAHSIILSGEKIKKKREELCEQRRIHYCYRNKI